MSNILKYYQGMQVTSQFYNCPCPFNLDSYQGCSHGCVYCFARGQEKRLNLNKRNKKSRGGKMYYYNSPSRLAHWCEYALSQAEDRYSKPHEVFFRHRVPVSIGAVSDPCQAALEPEYHVTEEFLKILRKYDYPIRLTTKNPALLYDILKRLGTGMNIVVGVSICTINDAYAAKLEPFAPSPTERLEAVKQIADLGYSVIIRAQPAIFPRSVNEAKELVERASRAGAWAINSEGLRLNDECRSSLLKDQRETMRHGLGHRIPHAWIYSYEINKQIVENYAELCERQGLLFYNANDWFREKIGCGGECCGTEALRNYELFNKNFRSFLWKMKRTNELDKCLYNFNFGNSGEKTRTIGDVINNFGKDNENEKRNQV
jgi:DNA repair photolyase